MSQIRFAGAAELSLMNFCGKNVGLLNEIEIGRRVIAVNLVENVV
jgi:hypothetical protein